MRLADVDWWIACKMTRLEVSKTSTYDCIFYKVLLMGRIL